LLIAFFHILGTSGSSSAKRDIEAWRINGDARRMSKVIAQTLVIIIIVFFIAVPLFS